MGATGWKYFVPYQPDVSLALQRLREDVFARGQYSSTAQVSKADVEAALKTLGSSAESMLQGLTARASDPRLPPQTREKFAALVRQYQSMGGSVGVKPKTISELLEREGENGTHSILDIHRISPTPDFGAISPLPNRKLIELFGSDKPTRREIERKYREGALEDYTSQRWKGICIIAHRGGMPHEIFFAGCSGD